MYDHDESERDPMSGRVSESGAKYRPTAVHVVAELQEIPSKTAPAIPDGIGMNLGSRQEPLR